MFRPDPSNLISPKPVNDSKISCVGAFRIHWGHIESIKLFFTSTMAGVEAGEVPFRHYDQVYSKVRKPWSNGGMIWKIFGWVDILDGVILTFTGWTYIYILWIISITEEDHALKWPLYLVIPPESVSLRLQCYMKTWNLPFFFSSFTPKM